MAVPVTALVGACLLGVAASCAGTAPKATAPAPAAVAPPPSAALPVASAEAPAPTESAAAPSESANVAPAPSDSAPTEPPSSSASLTPSPTPQAPPAAAPASAPRLLIADELPYAAHLRAHDAKAEHHHAREAATHEGGRPYHPAPGIVVDVVAAEGGTSAPDLQRVARNLGYWPFRQCYEEGLRREPHLAGKVSLELVVSPSGAVDRSAITSATVRDEIVAACIAREARHLALPASESPTTAKVDVALAVGDEPVPTGRPVPNAEKIREALRGSWGPVRRCYASALASHPNVGGRIELRFRLRHGEIVEVGESEGGARFVDPDVTRCVLGVYRTLRLPASTHATRERSFVYALQLESMPVEPQAQ